MSKKYTFYTFVVKFEMQICLDGFQRYFCTKVNSEKSAKVQKLLISTFGVAFWWCTLKVKTVRMRNPQKVKFQENYLKICKCTNQKPEVQLLHSFFFLQIKTYFFGLFKQKLFFHRPQSMVFNHVWKTFQTEKKPCLLPFACFCNELPANFIISSEPI